MDNSHQNEVVEDFVRILGESFNQAMQVRPVCIQKTPRIVSNGQLAVKCRDPVQALDVGSERRHKHSAPLGCRVVWKSSRSVYFRGLNAGAGTSTETCSATSASYLSVILNFTRPNQRPSVLRIHR
jgi:hypothetical protein